MLAIDVPEATAGRDRVGTAAEAAAPVLQAAALLTAAGFDDVRNIPTPMRAPALTAGRRPIG